MSKMYRTALGKQIDVDELLLKNETEIAVGNQKVNARGDLLGPGGKIVKTRDQVMKEYYALNTPVATDPADTIRQESKPTMSSAARPQPAAIKPDPINIPLEEAITLTPDSGLDDIDDGPAAEKIIDVPLAAQPVPIPVTVEEIAKPTPAPVVPPAPVTPKEIPLPVVQAENSITATQFAEQPKSSLPPDPPAAPMRGSLANAVHSASTITQKELLPPKKANGIQRF